MNKGGKAIWKPSGVKIGYPWVDLEKERVEARIEYEGNTLISVIIEVASGHVIKEGSFEEIVRITPDMSEEVYLKIMKEWATLFIQNGISNPTEYFNKLQN